MKKIILVLCLLSLGCTPKNDNQLKMGDEFPAINIMNIKDEEVVIPNSKVKYVHLQFRRFAGCPICNLHLQSFVKRNEELKQAGIEEVVVFHSPKESLLKFQSQFPFHVVGDPNKILYQQFGVESSIWSILNPLAWPAIIKGNIQKDKPEGDPEGGPLGLPADFLISADGKLENVHYGTHAYDQWTVDQVLEMAD